MPLPCFARSGDIAEPVPELFLTETRHRQARGSNAEGSEASPGPSSNLTAGFHTTRLALPAMKKKGFGRIVNIASAHALVASPYKSANVTANHGVAGFTKAVALEVA